MKSLFDHLSVEVSRRTTRTYSTSFSLGIHFLHERLRDPIYAIYGFVRVADEIVDSFEGFDQQALLLKYRNDTYGAIEKRISTNPILNSFQKVVHHYDIDLELIETFLKSMEMDLARVTYTEDKYKAYILGSAEVVGLMCLHVFTEGNRQQFQELKPYAMKLGSAFQKVNFLRDIKDDYHLLGRTYFPNVDMDQFSGHSKKEIESDIEEDFRIALIGIRKLPMAARGGVYLAYIYYINLFKKIRKLPPHQIFTERIRINNGHKFRLMLSSMFQYKMNLL